MRDLQWIVASNAAEQAAYDKRTYTPVASKPSGPENGAKGGQMTKATTKRAKRTAKRLFPKKSHATRLFTSADYSALPKE